MGAFCTCSRTSPFPNTDGLVEALSRGERPRVTISVDAHSSKSIVTIMRVRYLLGLSNANRQAETVDALWPPRCPSAQCPRARPAGP